jgi:hypothetical protein
VQDVFKENLWKTISSYFMEYEIIRKNVNLPTLTRFQVPVEIDRKDVTFSDAASRCLQC